MRKLKSKALLDCRRKEFRPIVYTHILLDLVYNNAENEKQVTLFLSLSVCLSLSFSSTSVPSPQVDFNPCLIKAEWCVIIGSRGGEITTLPPPWIPFNYLINNSASKGGLEPGGVMKQSSIAFGNIFSIYVSLIGILNVFGKNVSYGLEQQKLY